MVDDAKICLDCGSLDYRQKQYSSVTRYGANTYTLRADGSVDEEWEMYDDESEGDWDDEGSPECTECEGTDLLDIDYLTLEETLTLLAISDEDERIRVAQAMVDGEYNAEEEAEREGKQRIGGRKVFQT